MAEARKRLYRLPKEAMMAGVASGFARYFAMDVTLMRVLFVCAFFLTQGVAIVAYIALIFILPTPDEKTSKASFSEKVENVADEIKQNGKLHDLSTYIGVAVVVLGVWLLLVQFFPQLEMFRWNVVWPILIIAVGALIIVRSKNRE